MRATWTIAALLGAALLLAGFFAQGMARLAGLPASTPAPVPVASATTGTPASLPAAPVPATEPAPEPRSTQAAPATVADSVAASPTMPAPAAAPDPTPEIHSSAGPTPKPAVARAEATRRVANAGPAETATNTFSAAQVQEAQCRSLRAWLGELDALAQKRPDTASQAWVQSQRATTAERQAELRC